MIVDVIKFVGKIAIVAGAVALIVGVFVGIEIPAQPVNQLIDGIGTAKAIISYYCPAFYALFPLGFTLFGIEYSMKIARAGALAFRWLWRLFD